MFNFKLLENYFQRKNEKFMSDSTSSSVPTRRRRRWLRIVVWICGSLIVLVAVLYFVATSSAFFKGVILPQVSKALGAKVTVQDASISPFSHVILHNLKVQADGTEPVLTVAEIRARYSLKAILGGNIKVDEVAIVSPTISLVEQPDGSKNIDAILKALNKGSEKKSAPVKEKKPSKPMQVDVSKILISNATLRSIKNYNGNLRDVAEVTNFNFEIDGIQNGQTAKLTIGAEVDANNNPPPPGTNGSLRAALKGNFAFALSKDLMPASINGNLNLAVTKAEGAMADFSAVGMNLDTEVTPTEIKQILLRLARSGTTLGEVRVSGPLDMQKVEGRVNVEVSSIDKQILNLIGAKSGIDFGTTTINSTNQIELAKAGSTISLAGQFNIGKLQITCANQTTPVLDLRADYGVTINSAEKNALLSKLVITGTQNQTPFLDANLTSPMNFNWGGATSDVGNSALNLTVANFNLADWKAFAGEVIPSGIVNANVKLVSQQGGKELTFGTEAKIENLTVVAGGSQITQAAIGLQANGQAHNLQQFDLKQYGLQITRAGQSLVSVSGSATYDTTSGNADAHVLLKAALPGLIAAAPVPDVAASSGTVELQADVTQKEKAQTVTGKLTLANLTGQFGKSELQAFGANVNLDVVNNNQVVQLRKIDGGITGGGKPGGSFDISGKYDLAKKSAAITAKLTDFNQDGLRPFLEPLLGGKKLESIAINADTSAQFDPQAGSAVKANLQVANLVVKDPKNEFPATPLEAKMQVDASLEKQIADVRQFKITLTPTDRAKNELNFSGRVDMSRTNAITGSLKLAADSLDVTHYYDLFAGGSKPSAAQTSAAPTASNAPATNAPIQEPAPIQLPLQNFTVDANIGQFYLHEIEVTKLLADVKIDGGHVVINPFQLALNSAPVNADVDLNLGVPGWTYDVSLNANRISVLPIANSFLPDAKGQYNGFVSTDVKVQGAGITGANLKKNLKGNVSLVLSDANIQLVKSKTKIFFIPINLNLIATALNIPEIMDSPLTGVNVKINLGNGEINTQQAEVISPAFLANVHGVISIADNLNDSTLNLPVELSLANSLASKLTVTGGQQSAAGYTQLPVFVTVVGTLGKPETKKNAVVLLSLTANAAGGLIQGGTGKALKTGGTVVQGLEGLLGGRKSSEGTENTNTNKPKPNLFNIFNR